MRVLNLFYEEPDNDRLIPFDRYPRRILRTLLRGRPNPGGQMRVFLNLCAGLDRIGVKYRINNFSYARRHPDETACIIGKPHVLHKIRWENPIVFGAAVYNHPVDAPDLLEKLPVRLILVPGEWMRQMCSDMWGGKVAAWPVGIDTDRWHQAPEEMKDIDVLLYDKVRWEHDKFEEELIAPIRRQLARQRLKVADVKYGAYREEEFHSLVRRSKTMLFLCEHETQGIAYQQALACGVPILAWDRGGFWQDPSYFPHQVQYGPVSSVPYWDERCGVKFTNASDFASQLEKFLGRLSRREFSPRDYILENLTLEKCAEQYVRFCSDL